MVKQRENVWRKKLLRVLSHQEFCSECSPFDTPMESTSSKPSLTLTIPPQRNVVYASYRQVWIFCFLQSTQSFPLKKENPLISSIRFVKVEFCSIIPDFIIGSSICCLFLSLSYHCRNPEYIKGRVRELFHSPYLPHRTSSSFPYRTCYLLCLVNTNDINSAKAMQELNFLGVKENITLLLAWSNEQMAQHLMLMCQLEKYSFSSYRPKQRESHEEQCIDVLTSIPSITKNDAYRLLGTFGVCFEGLLLLLLLYIYIHFFSILPSYFLFDLLFFILFI